VTFSIDLVVVPVDWWHDYWINTFIVNKHLVS